AFFEVTRDTCLGAAVRSESNWEVRMLNRKVGFALLNNGRCQRRSACLKIAMNRLMHCSNLHFYSITSSTRASTEGGTVRPRALAVLRFTTNSNLVGRST